MDLVLAAGQGLGLALAAGILAGALAGPLAREGRGIDPIAALLLTLALIGGAYLFGASLETEDHPAWPGWPIGAAAAALAFAVIRAVVAGAASRAGGGASPTLIAGILVLGAAIVAAGSLAFGGVGLLAFIAVAYLALGRRRRAGQKYEGLRILRG